MKKHYAWLVLFCTSTSIMSCAVSPKLTPITNPVERIQSEGLSILPPGGSDWFITPSFRDPGGWTWAVNFRKILPGASLTHTFYAAVKTKSLGAIAFDRPELLQFLARELLEGSKREPQFTPLRAAASVTKCLEQDCVKYDVEYEDRSSRRFPGAVFIMTRKGFKFLHPDSAVFIVNVEYSERYLRGETSVSLDAEIKPFLESLVFTPLR